MSPSRSLWALIVVGALLRLAWSASFGMGNDEAYHYLYLTHPAPSYFDHPPMLAAVEGVGVALAGGRVAPWSLRLGFVILFAASTWLMARFTARFFGEKAGLLAALGLNCSAYHTAAVGAFALPDGPLLFFWLLTLDRVAAALERPEKVGAWLLVGLAWGGAMLSKYHAIFLPAGVVLFALLDRPTRSIFRRPGPYLAALVGLAAFSPVLAWNASHGWASFSFQGSRASAPIHFKPLSLLSAVGEQAAYLFPWIWWILLTLLVGRLRAFRHGASAVERFLVCQSVLPLIVFTAVACFRSVLPHWTLVGYLALFPLLGRSWESRLAAFPRSTRRRIALATAAPVIVAVLAAWQYRAGWAERLGLPKKGDVTVEIYGWDQVADEIRRLGWADPDRSFVLTRAWLYSGQMAFALRGSGLPVACYNRSDARGFAYWSRPEDWVGKDGVLVSVDDLDSGKEVAFEPGYIENYFERVEPPVRFEVKRDGRTIRNVRLFRCIRQKTPYRFDNGKPADRSRRPEG